MERGDIQAELPHKVPSLKVAKFLKLHLLLDGEAMKEMLLKVGPCAFYSTAKIVAPGQEVFSIGEYLDRYCAAELLYKEGNNSSELIDLFSRSMSNCKNAFASAFSSEDKVLLKARLPVIQMVPTWLFYSHQERTFRFALYGKGAILFGTTLIYPQLMQREDGQIVSVDGSSNFPNTSLFRKIRLWLREATIPTPFSVEGKKINVPVRISSTAFQWAGNIAGLKEQGISLWC